MICGPTLQRPRLLNLQFVIYDRHTQIRIDDYEYDESDAVYDRQTTISGRADTNQTFEQFA